MLARMLVGVATRSGADGDDARAAGHDQGRSMAVGVTGAESCTKAMVELLDRLGFDPQAVGDDDGSTTVAFARCPFGELATEHPELVCALHRGLVEGFADGVGGGEVLGFGSLVDRHPCRVQVVDR
jgi:hypothetical protein